MSQPLLEGQVEPEEVQGLRERVQQLEDELEMARAKTVKVRQESEAARRAISNLRQVLRPFHDAMRKLFGEMEAIGDEPGLGQSPRANAAWESWQHKLGGKQAEFIAAMLEHGHPMTGEQLRVATHTGRSTVPQIIYKLNQLGLIEKNAGKYSLKEL